MVIQLMYRDGGPVDVQGWWSSRCTGMVVQLMYRDGDSADVQGW